MELINIFLFSMFTGLLFWSFRMDKVSKFRRELMSKIIVSDLEDMKLQAKKLSMPEAVKSVMNDWDDDCDINLRIRWTILEKVSFEKQVFMFWKRPQDFYTPQEYLKMTTPSRGFMSSSEKH